MGISTWLEELASESNTIQAQEEYYSAGLIAGSDPRKIYVRLLRFFFDFSRSLNSFGTALCVVQDIGSVQVVVEAG